MPQLVLGSEVIAGGTIITLVAALSLIILLLMLLHIVLALALPAYAQRMSIPQERDFLLSPLGFYIICLFVGNLISAIGGVIQSQWVQSKAITQGPACSSQALLLQLGNNATALWIGLISISALRTFMFRIRSLSRMVALLLIGALWIAMILFDTLASIVISDHSSLYGIAFVWCWITPTHRTARLFMQYVWMWVWSLVSAMCFFLVFLSIRGNISVKKGELGRSVKWSKRTFGSYALGRGDERYGMLVGTVGRTMCWFPVCYITLTLPISVSRILETFGFPVPVYAFVFSAVCFLLLGISFPILYFAIRHSWKHACTGISPDSTLCGIAGDTPDENNLHDPKDKHVSPVDKPSPSVRTSISPTREYGFPSQHQDINKRPPSMVLNGQELDIYTYRGNIAPLRGGSVSSQLPPGLRSFHRPMSGTSTVTSSNTAVPARMSTTGDSDTISPQRQRCDSDASVYSGPRAISPDLNALFLASQIPTSSSGPPPPPRKIKRTPIASVPIDVDESDQGSISSTLSPIDVVAVQNIPLNAQKSPDSLRTFWAAYEGGSPMTPQVPSSADAALKLDARKAHQDRSSTTAAVPAPPLDIADIASPDSFYFQEVDPSVSVKPSISAVGKVGNKTAPKVIPVVRSNQRLSVSFAIPAPLPAVLSESGIRSSQSSAARFNDPSTRKLVLSDTSTNGSYRTPHFQPGYV